MRRVIVKEKENIPQKLFEQARSEIKRLTGDRKRKIIEYILYRAEYESRHVGNTPVRAKARAERLNILADTEQTMSPEGSAMGGPEQTVFYEYLELVEDRSLALRLKSMALIFTKYQMLRNVITQLSESQPELATDIVCALAHEDYYKGEGIPILAGKENWRKPSRG